MLTCPLSSRARRRGSAHGQRKYPPSCELRGSPHQLTLSRKSGKVSDVFGNERNSQILVTLPVTYVPRCTSSSAKTLGLKNLQRPNVATSGPPDGACELFIQQNSVPK